MQRVLSHRHHAISGRFTLAHYRAARWQTQAASATARPSVRARTPGSGCGGANFNQRQPPNKTSAATSMFERQYDAQRSVSPVSFSASGNAPAPSRPSCTVKPLASCENTSAPARSNRSMRVTLPGCCALDAMDA